MALRFKKGDHVKTLGLTVINTTDVVYISGVYLYWDLMYTSHMRCMSSTDFQMAAFRVQMFEDNLPWYLNNVWNLMTRGSECNHVAIERMTSMIYSMLEQATAHALSLKK